MAKKKKVGSGVELRANLNRALASSEQTSAALVDALAIIEGDNAAALVEAVKALRTIAGLTLATDMPGRKLSAAGRANDDRQDAYRARWFQGLARGALRAMGLP